MDGEYAKIRACLSSPPNRIYKQPDSPNSFFTLLADFFLHAKTRSVVPYPIEIFFQPRRKRDFAASTPRVALFERPIMSFDTDCAMPDLEDDFDLGEWLNFPPDDRDQGGEDG